MNRNVVFSSPLAALILLCGSARSQTGTVSQCAAGSTALSISPSSSEGAYKQPLTVNVTVPDVFPSQVALQTTGNTITVRLVGSKATDHSGFNACGTVRMNPVEAGEYSVEFRVSGGLFFGGELEAFETITLLAPPGPTPPSLPPTPPKFSPLPASSMPPPANYDLASTQAAGEIRFQPSVSMDGQAVVTVPIEVPPGRHGVEPSLALVYSSRTGNGPLGVGWRLTGLSSITACRRSPAIDGQFGGRYPDRFCLDSQRLVSLGGSEFRTEVDSYSKIVSFGPIEYPDSFQVYSPDGAVYYYASRLTAHSRLEGHVVSCVWGDSKGKDNFGGCAEGPIQRRAWMLDEVQDRFGNRMEIDYDSAETLLPTEIRYTYYLKPPLHGLVRFSSYKSNTKKVVFEYETRPDVRHYSVDGIDYTAKQRLTRIKVGGPLGLSDSSYASKNGTLRRYDFVYTTNPVTAQSTLTQITECEGDQADSPCKAPVSLSYSGVSIEFDDQPLPFVPTSFNYGQTYSWDGFYVADFNGDGFDDLLYRRINVPASTAKAMLDTDASSVVPAYWNLLLSDGHGIVNTVVAAFEARSDTQALFTGFVDLDRNQMVDAIIPSVTGEVYHQYKEYAIARTGDDGYVHSTILPVETYSDPQHFLSGMERIAAIGDLNGDGLPDLAITYGSDGGTYRWGVALNSSNQHVIQFTSPPMDFHTTPGPCRGTPPPSGSSVYINCPLANENAADPAFIVDIDGNGQNELVVPVGVQPGETPFRGTESFSFWGYNLELKALGFPLGQPSTELRTGLSSIQEPRVFIDVNGDGLPDSVSVDAAGRLWVAMNRGGSYDAPVQASVSVTAQLALQLPNEIRIGDFNNDGLEDIYLVSKGILLQADGNLGFVEKSLDVPVGDDNCTTADCPKFARRRWDQTLDVNGDGLIDLLQVREGQTHVLQRKGPAPALLQAVTGGPLTPEVRFVYKAAPEVQLAGSCTFPQNCLRKGMWLAAEMAIKADVLSNTYPEGFNRVLYKYENGRFDLRGRGWLGFGKRIETNEQTGETITTEFDNTTTLADSTLTTYRYPGVFRPIRQVSVTDTRLPSEHEGTIRRTTTQYGYHDQFVTTPSNCPCISSSTISEVRTTDEEALAENDDITGFSPFRSTKHSYDYNSYGLIINEIDETFEGGFNDDGTPAVPPDRINSLRITWVPDSVDGDNWLVQRFNKMTLTSTEPGHDAVAASTVEPPRPAVPEQTVTRTLAIEWLPNTNSIARVTTEPDSALTDPTLNNVVEFFRDALGNVRQIDATVRDANGPDPTRTLRIDWDTLDETTPYRVMDAAQHLTTTYYHAGLGLAAVWDDVNSLRTTVKFDSVGHPRAIDVPSDADITIDYALSDNGWLRLTNTSATGKISNQFVNKWGMLTRTEESRLNGLMARVDRTYTRLNQVATATVPYYPESLSAGTNLGPSKIVPAHTSFTYDSLGRVRQRTFHDGGLLGSDDALGETESWWYASQFQNHRSARGVISTVETDALSRVVGTSTIAPRPMEHRNTPPGPHEEVTVRFEYAPFNLLSAITDSAGNRIENHYDLRGRLREIKDSSRGTNSFEYNGYGELTHAVDAVGTRTAIQRDSLGRITDEIHIGTVAPFKRVEGFTWDTSKNGVGKLAKSVSTDNVFTEYTYDDLSRPFTKKCTVNGQEFTIARIWDAFDRLQRIQYPTTSAGKFALRYEYQQGSLFKIVDATSGESLWKLAGQAANQIALDEDFGKSIVTHRELDSRGRLTSIETTADNRAIQHISYEYGLDGFISSKHSFHNKATETYDYDFLGRLRHWIVDQRGIQTQQEYGYDDLGNLLSITATLGNGRIITNKYGPAVDSPNAGPDAVRETAENGNTTVFQYDSAGREVSSSDRTITWNEFSLPSEIHSSSQDVHFEYDVDHRRILKSSSSATNVYLGGIYERDTDVNGTRNLFNLVGPSGVFGQVVWPETTANGTAAQSTSFFNKDLLGTPDVISDDVTGMVQEIVYEPFGQRRDPLAIATPLSLPSTTRFGFTGHEADDEFGLINMNGRIYDPSTTRFLTPDPLIQGPDSSQSLNRYSYVYNNPTNFVDPSGFQGEDAGVYGTWDSGDDGGSDSLGWGSGEIQIGFGGGPSGGPASQQSIGTPSQAPSKADPTRQGADAGPGWGNGQSIFSTSVDSALGPQLYSADSSGPQLLSTESTFEHMWNRVIHSPCDVGQVGPCLVTPLDFIGHLLGEGLTFQMRMDELALKGDALMQARQANDEMSDLGSVVGWWFVGPREAPDPEIAEMNRAAERLMQEGNRISYGYATITSQAVEDSAGNRSIMGYVTGNDGDKASRIVRARDLAEMLNESAEHLGFEADFGEGRRTPDYHSEGMHHMRLIDDGLTPLGPTFINRRPCSWQCAAAQRAIKAIIIESQ